jgi:hypothetical protein
VAIVSSSSSQGAKAPTEGDGAAEVVSVGEGDGVSEGGSDGDGTPDGVGLGAEVAAGGLVAGPATGSSSFPANSR